MLWRFFHTCLRLRVVGAVHACCSVVILELCFDAKSSKCLPSVTPLHQATFIPSFTSTSSRFVHKETIIFEHNKLAVSKFDASHDEVVSTILVMTVHTGARGTEDESCFGCIVSRLKRLSLVRIEESAAICYTVLE